MTTDTLDPSLAAEIDRLLTGGLDDDVGMAPPPLCNVADVDALAELLRAALRRVARSTAPDTVQEPGGGDWLHYRERQFTRTCTAEVQLVIRVESVSAHGVGWVVLVSDQLLRYTDGSATVFDTPDEAMRAADLVLTETRMAVTLPTISLTAPVPRRPDDRSA